MSERARGGGGGGKGVLKKTTAASVTELQDMVWSQGIYRNEALLAPNLENSRISH